MPQRLVEVLVVFLCLGCVVSQEFEARFAQAEAAIRAKEWRAAADALLALQEGAQSDERRTLLASRLNTVGLASREAGDGPLAIRACEAALRLRLQVHGDRDHRAVATSLNNLAVCLRSSGHAARALVLNEQALAMRRRLYARDHTAVAASLNNVARCLRDLDRAAEALPLYEEALAMRTRLLEGRDDAALVDSISGVAHCLDCLGRHDEALSRHEQALAMQLRLCGTGDHPAVAANLSYCALCLVSLGRLDEALEMFERALAMRTRLYGDRDHEELADNRHDIAICLDALGRHDEALLLFQQTLSMYGRLFGERDHASVALNLNGLARCMYHLGRADDGLQVYGRAAAMLLRLHDGRDHAEAAVSIAGMARCLDALGRHGEALAQHERGLAMRRRLYGDGDHADVAASLTLLASCLRSLGRDREAATLCRQALAINTRLHGDRDHPDVASSLNDLAVCQRRLGRETDALQLYELAMAMELRLYGERDHVDVATSRNNVGICLRALGRLPEALHQLEEALAMRRRLHGGRDHQHVAGSLDSLAVCLRSLGRVTEALARHEEALAMRRRLFGDRDHARVVWCLANITACQAALDRREAAVNTARQACAMIERLRDDTRTSSERKQSFFDLLKHGGAFEQLQELTLRDDPAEALAAAERSRGRDLLDLFEQQGFDPLEEAERRARQRGDEPGATALARLRDELTRVTLADDRLLHQLTRLDDVHAADREARRETLVAESNALAAEQRRLLDERARRLGDVLPVGRVRTAAEIQSALQQGELFLEFTLTENTSVLYVIARDGGVAAVELPAARATLARVLPALLQSSSHRRLRGLEPDGRPVPGSDAASSRELFRSLVPAEVWMRVRGAKRVFVAAHRELHRLPFELLVTDVVAGEPVYWLDAGPPISYVPSGSALHWLRQRARDGGDDATGLDLLAVGDPRGPGAAPLVPEGGAFVAAVDTDGEGARVGLQPGDVLLSYDGHALTDDKALRDARMATEKAVEDGAREASPIPLGVWRRGARLALHVRPGPLGIRIAPGAARAAWEAMRRGDAGAQLVTRAGDLERLHDLPPLVEARAEAAAIDRLFADRGRRPRLLVGEQAAEPAVFDLAAKARFVHFACHGIAEEYAGQSLSMLVLAQPQHVLPGDDGLLELHDLLHAWRGRLASCRLVVLSACRTNVGITNRDDAPQALPIGFLFAGVPAVVSSLWAVDDASTRALMVDFYGRLLGGETDVLAAFTAAKKALRATHPEPFHWAPFLYLGAPE